MKQLCLICNAHLDPVWLWRWEEGAAEAISTFRVAADFCQEYDAFIFNHNEVTLYRWVEEYEPALFRRIQRLVGEGKWHIMGGWYLQPDCNMPSGESFARQVLHGRKYFQEKFGVRPTTAINFDPFGHSRGLVQILAKSGYDSYIHCRPGQEDCPLPGPDYLWQGYDGSTVVAHRAFEAYLSLRGQAAAKVERYLDAFADKPAGMVLWGIGDHGGGPSREDVQALAALIEKHKGRVDIRHSTPEEYFQALRESGAQLPVVAREINPWAPGCYTSQVNVKQAHRDMENLLYMTEKMCSAAALGGVLAYPGADMEQAVRDLLVCEFHDVLPGSSIQIVEEESLRMLHHGMEILSRLRARAFFALCGGQPKAAEGEIPVLVYNPHPYEVETLVECEFNLPDQNWGEGRYVPAAYQQGRRLPSQLEKEDSNVRLDWRKKLVFHASLAPSSISRFDCRLALAQMDTPARGLPPEPPFVFDNGRLRVVLNTATGRLDSVRADGIEYLGRDAFRFAVMQDNADSWGSGTRAFPKAAGEFALLSPERGARMSGLGDSPVPSVRLVEDGEVRTVVEAALGYGDSALVVTYKLPKAGTDLSVDVRVFWQEKDRMLKLCLPVALDAPVFQGQTAFGVEAYDRNSLRLPEDELVAQRYILAGNAAHALSVLIPGRGSYGFSRQGSALCLTLLRSPAYAALPAKLEGLTPAGRFTARMDQGERLFQYTLCFGDAPTIEGQAHRRAQTINEAPFALSFFPAGGGEAGSPAVVLEDPVISLSAFKRAEDGNGYILRLFNPTAGDAATHLTLPGLSLNRPLAFGPYEVKTFRLLAEEPALVECDLTERAL